MRKIKEAKVFIDRTGELVDNDRRNDADVTTMLMSLYVLQSTDAEDIEEEIHKLCVLNNTPYHKPKQIFPVVSGFIGGVDKYAIFLSIGILDSWREARKTLTRIISDAASQISFDKIDEDELTEYVCEKIEHLTSGITTILVDEFFDTVEEEYKKKNIKK